MSRNRTNQQVQDKPDESDKPTDQAPQAPQGDTTDTTDTTDQAPQAPQGDTTDLSAAHAASVDADANDAAGIPDAPLSPGTTDQAPQAPQAPQGDTTDTTSVDADADALASAISAAVDAVDPTTGTFPVASLEKVHTAAKRFTSGNKRQNALTAAIATVQDNSDDGTDSVESLKRIKMVGKVRGAYTAHLSTRTAASAPASVDPVALALSRCQALQAAHAAVLASLADADAARVVSDLGEPTSADAVNALGIAPTPDTPDVVTEQAWRPIVRALVGRGVSVKRSGASGARQASGTIPSLTHAVTASDSSRSWTSAQIVAEPTNIVQDDGNAYKMSTGAVTNAMVDLVRKGVLTIAAAPDADAGKPRQVQGAPGTFAPVPDGTPIGTFAVKHADHGTVDADA